MPTARKGEVSVSHLSPSVCLSLSLSSCPLLPALSPHSYLSLILIKYEASRGENQKRKENYFTNIHSALWQALHYAGDVLYVTIYIIFLLSSLEVLHLAPRIKY